mgnify:CR=1 FL=1
MADNAPSPVLIEPGVRYFLSKSLEQCHKVKDYYHTRTFNFTMGLVFFICLGIFLYVRYKGKPTPEEIDAKKRQQQEYILSKLKMVNATHYAQSKGIPMDARIHPAGNGGGDDGFMRLRSGGYFNNKVIKLSNELIALQVNDDYGNSNSKINKIT